MRNKGALGLQNVNKIKFENNFPGLAGPEIVILQLLDCPPMVRSLSVILIPYRSRNFAMSAHTNIIRFFVAYSESRHCITNDLLIIAKLGTFDFNKKISCFYFS